VSNVSLSLKSIIETTYVQQHMEHTYFLVIFSLSFQNMWYVSFHDWMTLEVELILRTYNSLIN